jgi:hypothetical protein
MGKSRLLEKDFLKEPLVKGCFWRTYFCPYDK